MLKIKKGLYFDIDGPVGGGSDQGEPIENFAKDTSSEGEKTKTEQDTKTEPNEKAAWEAKQAKMQDDYKKIEAERNRLQSTFSKFGKALEENGVAKLDEDLNLVILKNQNQTTVKEEVTDPIQDIDNKIDSLTNKYDENEINEKEYFRKIANLEAKKVKIEVINEQQQAKIREQNEIIEKKEKESINKDTNSVINYLNDKYVDHAKEGSVLFNEMEKLMNENPIIYGDPNNNMRNRLLLAKDASLNLAQSKTNKEKEQQSNIDKFSALGSGSYDKDKTRPNDEMSQEEERVYIKSGLNQSTIDKIKKSNFHHKIRQLDTNGENGFVL